MASKDKRRGLGLNVKTFTGRDGRSYLVFRTPAGSFHTFVEIEAKQAARECGAKAERNTRAMWRSIWDSQVSKA